MKQMDENHDGGDGHGDDQVLGLGKEKKQKTQGKGIIDRNSFVLVIKTVSECDHI
jgi:hypothetical protein